MPGMMPGLGTADPYDGVPVGVGPSGTPGYGVGGYSGMQSALDGLDDADGVYSEQAAMLQQRVSALEQQSTYDRAELAEAVFGLRHFLSQLQDRVMHAQHPGHQAPVMPTVMPQTQYQMPGSFVAPPPPAQYAMPATAQSYAPPMVMHQTATMAMPQTAAMPQMQVMPQVMPQTMQTMPQQMVRPQSMYTLPVQAQTVMPQSPTMLPASTMLPTSTLMPQTTASVTMLPRTVLSSQPAVHTHSYPTRASPIGSTPAVTTLPPVVQRAAQPARAPAPPPVVSSAPAGPSAEMKAKCEAIFAQLDLNRDGRITKAEFIKALRSNSSLHETFHLPAEIREGLSHAQFETTFQGIDTSGDRVITYEELQSWFAQQQGIPLVQARPIPVAPLAITN